MMFNNDSEDGLIATLNNLLTSLDIPITVAHAFDLVPSLILAIFESLLRTRLPISPETRKSATYPARVEAMKIFIGVLGDDILGVDVGLAQLDPRRLAEGREEELMYVSEILCWMGKKMGYLTKDGLVPLHRAPVDLQEELQEGELTPNAQKGSMQPSSGSLSPSTFSTFSASHASSLLVDSTRGPDGSIDSQTTVSSIHEDRDVDEHDDLLDGPSFFTEQQTALSLDHSHSFSLSDLEEFPRSSERSRRRRPDATSRPVNEDVNYAEEHPDCAFEHGTEGGEDILFSSSMSYCPPHAESYYYSVKPSVRTTGHLSKVDFARELEEYERRRKSQSSSQHVYHEKALSPVLGPVRDAYRASNISRYNMPTGSHRIVTRHTSPSQHALALLNERARLLSELARLKMMGS